MKALLWLCAAMAALGLLVQHQGSTAWLGLGSVLAVVAWATRRRRPRIAARRAGVPVGLGGGLHLGAGAGRVGVKLLRKRATWLVIGAVALFVVGYSVRTTAGRTSVGVIVAALAVLWWSRHRQATAETPTGRRFEPRELLARPTQTVAKCRRVAVTVGRHFHVPTLLRRRHESGNVDTAVTVPLSRDGDVPWLSPTVTDAARNPRQNGPLALVSSSASAARCQWCGSPLAGRQTRYCSRACQQARYRRDHQAKSAEEETSA